VVLRKGRTLALIGLGVVLAASAGAGRALRMMFPGAGGGRPEVAAFLLVTAAVLAVTLLAAYVPARRASRVNPTDALRYE
jgi:putative ABC transport system permease protein